MKKLTTFSLVVTTSVSHFFLDLAQIYTSQAVDPEYNVRTLQAKVMFNIRYYFACRGGENMGKMKKTTFKLVNDVDTGMSYIKCDKDKLTKNHKNYDEEMTTTFMPEMKNNKHCPVQSFLTYLCSLHKDSDSLWQNPRYTRFPEDPRV